MGCSCPVNDVLISNIIDVRHVCEQDVLEPDICEQDLVAMAANDAAQVCMIQPQHSSEAEVKDLIARVARSGSPSSCGSNEV